MAFLSSGKERIINQQPTLRTASPSRALERTHRPATGWQRQSATNGVRHHQAKMIEQVFAAGTITSGVGHGKWLPLFGQVFLDVNMTTSIACAPRDQVDRACSARLQTTRAAPEISCADQTGDTVDEREEDDAALGHHLGRTPLQMNMRGAAWCGARIVINMIEQIP